MAGGIAMTKKDQIIKMSVIGIIAALVLVFFAIPTISEIFGYYFCDNVEDIHSPALKEDKTVKVRFDSVISVFDIKSMYYMKYFSENYYLLRIGEDKYLHVRIPTADIAYWKGVTLYKKPSEALDFNGDKKYALIGKIKRLSDEEQDQLLQSVNKAALQDYEMIISEDMTNPDLYIDVINIKKELIFVAIECAVLLILAWIFIKSLQKYKELEADET